MGTDVIIRKLQVYDIEQCYLEKFAQADSEHGLIIIVDINRGRIVNILQPGPQLEGLIKTIIRTQSKFQSIIIAIK